MNSLGASVYLNPPPPPSLSKHLLRYLHEKGCCSIIASAHQCTNFTQMCMCHIALYVGMNATIPFDFGFLTMNPGAANFASHPPMLFDHQLEMIS